MYRDNDGLRQYQYVSFKLGTAGGNYIPPRLPHVLGERCRTMLPAMVVHRPHVQHRQHTPEMSNLHLKRPDCRLHPATLARTTRRLQLRRKTRATDSRKEFMFWGESADRVCCSASSLCVSSVRRFDDQSAVGDDGASATKGDRHVSGLEAFPDVQY